MAIQILLMSHSIELTMDGLKGRCCILSVHLHPFAWIKFKQRYINLGTLTYEDTRMNTIRLKSNSTLLYYFREVKNEEISYLIMLFFIFAEVVLECDYGVGDIAWNKNGSGESPTGISFVFDLPQEVPAVPIPPAVWLLGSGLIGIVGIRRKIKK